MHKLLGAELTAKKKEVIWDAEIEDDPPGELDIVHTLHIQRVRALVYCSLSRASARAGYTRREC